MTDLSLHGLAHALRDERWSAITHGAGAVLGAIGGIVLITLAALWGDGWQLASAIVFSVTLILLYTASAFYHAAPFKTALKARLKVLDHCAIYLLIAGTYTPISLVGLREHGGWWMFGAIWTLAVGGVVFKLLTRGRFKLLSTLIYIAMGWLAIVAIKPMTEQLSTWARSVCFVRARACARASVWSVRVAPCTRRSGRPRRKAARAGAGARPTSIVLSANEQRAIVAAVRSL